MDTIAAAPQNFGETFFGKAQLGDQRRTARLVKTANQIVNRPGGTLPDKLQAPADLKALYRLVENDQVTHASVLQPAREYTLGCMGHHDPITLILHDTTQSDYTGQTTLKNIGQIGNGSRQGYLCHNSLAVTAETWAVLGPANQVLFFRPAVVYPETREQRRSRENRESRLWKRGAEAI